MSLCSGGKIYRRKASGLLLMFKYELAKIFFADNALSQTSLIWEANAIESYMIWPQVLVQWISLKPKIIHPAVNVWHTPKVELNVNTDLYRDTEIL